VRSVSAPGSGRGGLPGLRRGGSVTELLFLYEAATRDVPQLRTVAEALGLTVQAVSHTFRGLRRRGLVQLENGRYRPTVAGVDFLHSTFGELQTDLSTRLEHLHIVRTTRALAGTAIPAGATVRLSLEDGLLTAWAGRDGASRGVARTAARAGELVEVERLEGIVPLERGETRVLTIPDRTVRDRGTARALASAIRAQKTGLIAAHGLEAYLLAQRAAPGRSVIRFGIAAAVEEAAQLGVASTVVVLDRDVPNLLAQFSPSRNPMVEFVRVGRGRPS
jgi:putative transcriptional regulator